MNLLSQNYDYLSQYGSNQCRHQAALAGFAALMPHHWRLRPGQQAEPVYIISKIPKTNLSFGPGDAYGSYNQVACPHLLDSEDVFNSAASFRTLVVSFYLTLSQLLVTAALLLNMATIAFFFNGLSFFQRAVSRISPNILAAVVFIKQFFKDIAVMDRSRRYFIAANKFMLNGLAIGKQGLFGKQSMYEHSMRVPLVVAGPGIKHGTIDSPVYLQDIMPTTLELAGATVPPHVQFKSLLPAMKGGKPSYDAIYGGYKDLQRMVIDDNYKMILYPTIQRVLLYNLKKDPNEMNDLAGCKKYDGLKKKLFAKLLTLEKETGDTLCLKTTFPNLCTKEY